MGDKNKQEVINDPTIGGNLSDTVRCNNCMAIGEVLIGREDCPNCGFEGGLMDWPIK